MSEFMLELNSDRAHLTRARLEISSAGLRVEKPSPAAESANILKHDWHHHDPR